MIALVTTTRKLRCHARKIEIRDGKIAKQVDAAAGLDRTQNPASVTNQSTVHS
jgi:hypothetical protein